MIEKIARKLYRTIFPVKEVKLFANIKQGKLVSIDTSAILMTSKNGKIIFEGNNYIGRQVEIGTEGTVKIAVGTTIQDRCILLGDIEIGRFCTFAPNVYMSSGRHYYNHNPNFYIRDQDELVHSDAILSKEHSRKIIIEDDVWLGINSVIMSGVKIGRGAVIGSNSVVTKDVDPFSVVAGLPAKLIKKRLDFIPKSFLSYNNEDDLPNFYKGIFVDLKNLKTDRANGGLAASNSFILYLIKEGEKLVLTVKKCISQPLTIRYGSQTAELTNEFTDVLFDPMNEHYHQFQLDVNAEDGSEKFVLIKEVKIISKNK